jgi:hypothetical protein
MRLMRDGQDLKEIRAYIDAEYSKYGPPTKTGPIQDEPKISCSNQTTTVCGSDSSSNPTLADEIEPEPII